MSRPHLRINCADPAEDSCPGRITVRVLAPSRTRLFQALLPLHGRSDRGVSPNQRNDDACPHNGPELSAHPPRSGGTPAHLSPLPCPGSKRATRRQNPQRPFIFFFLGCRPHLSSVRMIKVSRYPPSVIRNVLHSDRRMVSPQKRMTPGPEMSGETDSAEVIKKDF
jgi:hypothetical protein